MQRDKCHVTPERDKTTVVPCEVCPCHANSQRQSEQWVGRRCCAAGAMAAQQCGPTGFGLVETVTERQLRSAGLVVAERRCCAAGYDGRAATRPYRLGNVPIIIGKWHHPSRVTCHSRGFTLIELLVVIAILGIMAGLTVPVLKNFAKSDATLGASRQLLDGVARARQLAISQRTTVYMVFVSPNFWNFWGTTPANFSSLTPAQQTAATNLCDKQFTGYTFVSLRSVGDQPGQGMPHYLATWQTLPDDTFIATNKFESPGSPPFFIPSYNPNVNIYGFNTNQTFPFPTADATLWIPLPWIAFNYLGQLATNGPSGVGMSVNDEYIPIAKGSVLYARDPASKTFLFNSPDVLETPPGNSTNSSYNIVHIDRLTGRAVLQYQKTQ